MVHDMLRKALGTIISLVSLGFVFLKFVADWVGRSTFWDDVTLLGNRVQPMIEFIAEQPAIAFYGTMMLLALIGLSPYLPWSRILKGKTPAAGADLSIAQETEPLDQLAAPAEPSLEIVYDKRRLTRVNDITVCKLLLRNNGKAAAKNVSVKYIDDGMVFFTGKEELPRTEIMRVERLAHNESVEVPFFMRSPSENRPEMVFRFAKLTTQSFIRHPFSRFVSLGAFANKGTSFVQGYKITSDKDGNFSVENSDEFDENGQFVQAIEVDRFSVIAILKPKKSTGSDT